MIANGQTTKAIGAVRVKVAPLSRSERTRVLGVWLLIITVISVALVVGWRPVNHAIESLSLGGIEKVSVMGDLQYVPENAVIETLKPYADQPVALLHLSQIQEDLEAINWVDRVKVQRKLPNELIVTIIPQRPVARWKDQGLVNNRGEIFMVETIAQEFAQLPLLDGEQASLPEIMATYIDVQQVLREKSLSIIELARSSRGSWQLITTSGATVLFGENDLVGAAQRFVSVYQHLGQNAHNKKYDTRHSGGVAVL